MKYIGKIAVAIQNISEGDLNTQIEVVGGQRVLRHGIEPEPDGSGYPEAHG